jgi:HlyD family secretion protein
MSTPHYIRVVKKYLSNTWVMVGAGIVLVTAVLLVQGGSSNAQAEIFSVKTGTVQEGVRVTGKVKAAQALDLSFERNGKVTVVSKHVGDRVVAGDIILKIDNREAAAELAQAQAALQLQQSKLNELIDVMQPEQISLTKAKLASAELELNNARTALVAALQDAATRADDAIHLKIDQMFNNPNSSNPQLAFVSKIAPEKSLESGRVEVEVRLRDLKNTSATIKPTNEVATVSLEMKSDLGEIKLFLDTLDLAVTSLTGNEEYLTPGKVATWKADMLDARTSVNSAITAIFTAENRLALAQNNFDVLSKQLAFDTSSAATRQITAQRAQVAQAQANIAAANVQLTKTTMKAPISGIVTKLDSEVGETVIANEVVVSVISDAQYEIEAYIPEIDIAKVHSGEIATITLDAYESDVTFTARVVRVDPAETVLGGVPTYKTTFQFEGTDNRIKSGMTAHVEIVGQKREQVLYVPDRAITNRNGQKFVTRKKADDTTEDIVVKTGIRGVEGTVEITEGLSVGDIVILNQE